VEAAQAGAGNARFEVLDVEAHSFQEQFDVAFSRMGTMFFANPVAALRNVREALAPGGRLAMVVWRSKVENEGFYRSQLITERFVSKPEEYDEPTCGPGPFSMGNADTTSGILLSAGFESISLLRCDKPILIGTDLEEAVEFVMSIGPAGEILRLAGERAAHLHEPVAAALREEMAEWVEPDGTVMGPASTWIVTASAPDGDAAANSHSS
jgi:SAM-dependent methyltransferase